MGYLVNTYYDIGRFTEFLVTKKLDFELYKKRNEMLKREKAGGFWKKKCRKKPLVIFG